MQERKGIDRIFIERKTGARRTIEYKADEKAHITGNVFIETISVDSHDVPGWGYTSQADWLLYYIVGNNLVCIAK